MTAILIVDDDHFVRDLLHATLSFGDLELAVAHDGAAALAMLETKSPDLVILDLDLPGGKSGLDVLREARARGVTSRFIVLTGSGTEREPAVRAAGAFDFVTKPFSPLALIARIEAALPNR